MKVLFGTVLLPLFLAACNGPNIDPSLGLELGRDEVNTPPQPIPTDPPVEPPPPVDPPPPNPGGGGSTAKLGESCHSDDPNYVCLSLKYVVYENSQGTTVVSEQEALANLDRINSIWSNCNIGFEIGNYAEINPLDYGLYYNTQTMSELGSIRNAFVDDTTLLVVTTGTWSGSLGAGAANAWTTMPGYGPFGAVLEAPVATYPNIIAHELGHYLNLGHASDATNVMNPIVYQGSTGMSSSQCTAARSAVHYYWRAMLR